MGGSLAAWSNRVKNNGVARRVTGALKYGAVNDTFNALVAARNDSHAVAALEPVVVTHAQDGSGSSRGLATV